MSIRCFFGRLAASLAAAAILATAAWAVQPEEILDDPALETRARALSKELRCVVCRNQSIDDSDAQIAQDMRKLVRERLVAGDSDGEIKNLMVSYYGDYVLMTPRLSWSTAALWLAPGALLLLGGVWAARRLRAGGRVEQTEEAAAAGPAPIDAQADLTDAERTRLDEILRRGG